MQLKYKESEAMKQKTNQVIQTCNDYLESLPSMETIDASLMDAIKEKELFDKYQSYYTINDKKFTWLTQLEKESQKMDKKLQLIEQKLKRMENDNELQKTLDYWKTAEQTLSFVESKKDSLQFEKQQWEIKMQNMNTYQSLLEKQKHSLDNFNKIHQCAYKAWIEIGEDIKQAHTDALQKQSEMNIWKDQLETKKNEYNMLLEEKQQHDKYLSWETKKNILEKQLQSTQYHLYQTEMVSIQKKLTSIQTMQEILELQKTASQAIQWYHYQDIKQELTEAHARYSLLHTLLDQYKRDTRRHSSKSASLNLMQALFKEWSKRRDLLQRLDERLVNEKGKKTGDVDTFKEWIYAQHVIPLLERQVNRFLSNVETIRFRMMYTSKNLLYYVQDRGNETSFGASSGYQQFVIGLAMRQALTMLGGSSTCLQHMFIDEGFTACDAKNLEKTHDVLKLLIDMGHYKSILLVTHLDYVKDMVPLKINIQRTDAFSKLTYGLPYPTFTNGIKRRGRPKTQRSLPVDT
jgi:DNA repair exonuclease SbcCD ATPase subunit